MDGACEVVVLGMVSWVLKIRLGERYRHGYPSGPLLCTGDPQHMEGGPLVASG